MKTIETTIVVDECIRPQSSFLPTFAPGPHRVVMVIEESDDRARPPHFRGPRRRTLARGVSYPT